MSGFYADTTTLLALADRMSVARESVAHAARRVDVAATPAAGGPIAGAIADFCDHWRYGLGQLVGNLDACAHALQDAAHAYQRVEHAVERAAGGG